MKYCSTAHDRSHPTSEDIDCLITHLRGTLVEEVQVEIYKDAFYMHDKKVSPLPANSASTG